MNRSFWHRRDARKVAPAEPDPRTAQTQTMPRVTAAAASPNLMSGMPRQAESIGLRQPAAPGAYGRPTDPNPIGETMRVARPANPNQPTFIVPQTNGKGGKPTSTKEQK